jgi:hypothetical protein
VGSKPAALALSVGREIMPSEVVKPEDVPQNLQILNVPEWFASGFQVMWAGNDPLILLNKPVPTAPPPGGGPQLAFVAPVGILRLSSEALKELYLAIGTSIEHREKDTGRKIETDLTRQTASEQKRG